jgi:GGDEF domain-containing protein
MLALFQVEFVRGDDDARTQSEFAMREVADAICGSLSSDDLCIRSADRDYLVALQSSVKQAEDMVDRVRTKVAKRMQKSARRTAPGIGVAFLPLGNVVELSASDILEFAIERMRIALKGLDNQVVVLAPFAAGQALSSGSSGRGG